MVQYLVYVFILLVVLDIELVVVNSIFLKLDNILSWPFGLRPSDL